MRARRVLALAMLFACSSPSPSTAAQPLPLIQPEPEFVRITPDDVRPRLALTEPLLDAIASHQWKEAIEGLTDLSRERLAPGAAADVGFLRAWTRHRAGEGAEVRWSPSSEGTVPQGYQWMLAGELALAREAWAEAAEAFGEVDPGLVVRARADALRADALLRAGRKAEASALHAGIVAGAVSAATPVSLLTLAEQSSDPADAHVHARRLWTEFPLSAEAAAAEPLLANDAPPPTAEESSKRAAKLMGGGQYSAAIALVEPLREKHPPGDEVGCRLAYVHGRSWYKLNKLSASVAAFGKGAEACVSATGSFGEKIAYLEGYAQFRRGRFSQSAAAYAGVAERYPETSYADDGLTRAGIALIEADDLEGAMTLWRRGLELYPGGDTVPEATWRLAFSLYEQGRTAEAIEVAERLSQLSPEADEVHVYAGRYWSARWRLYPDVEHPSRASEDPSDREAAIVGWVALMEAAPQGFYALLAYNRLLEVAPDRARSVVRPTADVGEDWVVRSVLVNDPRVAAGADLARLGLAGLALDEWSSVDHDALTPDEAAWLTDLRWAAGDWLMAHGHLHEWLRGHPFGTLGPREPLILRLAYPNRYWSEIRTAAKGYDYEPRLFHALVREESNFNKEIVSFAGARGLSQLMPATARDTAGWLGREVTNDQLFDPVTNLTIGGRYLQAVYHQQSDNPYLALASYNAGPTRVSRWVDEQGNPPIDEWVERIPIRETRGYVKRVMGTWQAYRWIRDLELAPFADLSRFNHVAKP